jgi:nitroreductase
METLDAIRARRNVRRFTDEPIPAEHLDQILEAGRRAPSAKNAQPWDFILVTDRAMLQELSTLWVGAGHIAGAQAAIVVVLEQADEERRNLTNRYDEGQATMAMLLAATDFGIGTGHSSVGDQDRARELLGIPSERVASHMIDLGYPADGPIRPLRNHNRRPFDEVVHRGRW